MLQNVFNRFAGTVDFAAGNLSTLPTAPFTLATIRVRALAQAASTPLAFSVLAPRASDVTYAGASLTPSLLGAFLAVQAVAPPVTLAALAPAAAVRIDSTFDVTLEVRAGSKQVDGAAAYVSYDPSAIQVVSISGGTTLPQAIENTYDNTAGRPAYSAGAFDSFPTGTFTLATVRFRALGVTASTTIDLVSQSPRTSDVTFGGRSLGVTLNDATVTVVRTDRVAVLSMQPTHPQIYAGESFDVALTIASGAQEIDGAAGYLDFDPSVVQVVRVTPGTALSIGILNQFNNTTGRLDYVAGEFVHPPSGTFTLATVRFRALAASPSTALAFADVVPRTSDLAYGGESVMLRADDGTVTVQPVAPGVVLSLVADPPVVTAGDTFDLVARVAAGSQPVDGGAAYIDFDPSALQVLSVTAGTTLGTVIQSAYDNALGHVDFAAGDLDQLASGPFDLVRVRVRALRLATTPVILSTAAARRSDVTFAGTSVVTERRDLSLTVGSTGVDLGLVPAQPTVGIGRTIDVAVGVRAGAKQVDGGAAFLQFDPLVFEVTAITPGTALPQVILNRYDNLSGTVDLVQGTFANFPTGTFTLGTVRLKARAASAGSVVQFTAAEPRQSDVTFAGLSLLSFAAPRTIQVNGGGVILALVPPAVPIIEGDVFDVGLEVRAGTQQVDGVAGHIDFAPGDVQVVSVTMGTALPDGILSSFDNGAGTIDLAAGAFSGFPTGTFTAGTLRFRALRVATSTLAFHAAAPQVTDVSFGGFSVLGGAQGAQLAVAPTPTPTPSPTPGSATINGSVLLQGRPAAPDTSWSVPLRLSLRAAGGSGPDYSFLPTSDQLGSFMVSGIAEGSYMAAVKNPHTLSRVLSVTLGVGHNALDFPVLREGDANDDDCVELDDFSLLVLPFGRCVGESGCDDRPDFNEDGCVILPDFSLLATNYSLCGEAHGTGAPLQVGAVDSLVSAPQPTGRRAPFETPPEEGGSSGRTGEAIQVGTKPVRAEEAPSFQGPSRSPWVYSLRDSAQRVAVRRAESDGVGGAAAVAAVPRRRQVQVGETFSMRVMVQARSVGVDGVAVYARFDPAVLELVDAQTTGTLPVLLQDETDAVRGAIALAAGTLDEVPRRRFTFAILTFRARARGRSALRFESEVPRQTDATLSGRSVLRFTSGAVIGVIGGGSDARAATPTPGVRQRVVR